MKIADFGLARDIHKIDYYRKTTDVSKNVALHCIIYGLTAKPFVSCRVDFLLNGWLWKLYLTEFILPKVMCKFYSKYSLKQLAFFQPYWV